MRLCGLRGVDGQTALRGRDSKRKFPQFHRKVLLGVGPFHQFAHFLFCSISGFWWCLVCCCCCYYYFAWPIVEFDVPPFPHGLS